jgi:hypothetical protein
MKRFKPPTDRQHISFQSSLSTIIFSLFSHSSLNDRILRKVEMTSEASEGWTPPTRCADPCARVFRPAEVILWASNLGAPAHSFRRSGKVLQIEKPSWGFRNALDKGNLCEYFLDAIGETFQTLSYM